MALLQTRRGEHYDAYTEIEDEIEELENETEEDSLNLPILCGPVVQNLDTVLKKNSITLQAYHGRSMVGNHCHRYLKNDVIDNICNSVVSKTKELVQNEDVISKANQIKEKFKTINQTYAEVHNAVSHCKPISPCQQENIKTHIETYMSTFRSLTNTKITPKQHLLECHCAPFIQKWGFGLGLLGEQGGEECHAFVNILKNRTYGVKREEDRLRILMREHMTLISPDLRLALPNRRKKSC